MRHILAICGYIGSGKTTLANMLVAIDPDRSAHFETSTVVVSLADQFNQAFEIPKSSSQSDVIHHANLAIQSLLSMLSKMSDDSIFTDAVIIDPQDVTTNPDWYIKLFDYAKLLAMQPDLRAQAITADNKNAYRSLLQWIGGYFLYKLKDPTLWYKALGQLIAELPSDITFVALTAPRQPAEALFVQQQLHGQVARIDRPNTNKDMQEVTEKRIGEIVPDSTVINNGSLKQLQSTAEQLYSDLLNNNLAKHY